MEPLLTLIKEVVDNKSQTPSSLNNNISIQPSFELIKDTFQSEGVNIYSPIKSNKENSNTKKNQQKDNIIDELTPESEHHLDFLSPQSSNQPSSLIPKVSSAHKLSTIEEQTKTLTAIKESKLESRLLFPTTLSRSSSDEPVSLKELEIIKESTVSGEEKGGQEKSRGTLQSCVYSHNRDGLSRILEEQNIKQNYEGCEEGPTKSKIITNIPVTSNISSSEASTDVSSILFPSLSVSIDSMHSEKSVFGDMYSVIRDGHQDVAVSPCPSPAPISNTTPLRNLKDRRTGILHSMEDRYPSPGAYFTMKSGPMGDLSGGLSPHKRPNFLSTPNTTRNERLPVPSIDTSRPERSKSGRMAREGWPISPRRMQLASPRFKSLSDLVEDPESSEQQSEAQTRRSNSSSPSNNENSAVPPSTPSKLNLDVISEDAEEEEPEQNVHQEHDENAASKNDGHEKLLTSIRSKSSRFVDLPPNNNETVSLRTGVQSLRNHQPLQPSGRPFSRATKSPNVGGTSILEDMKSISKEMMKEDVTLDQEEENPDQEQKEKSKGRNEKRLSDSFTSNLGGISEIEEEEEEEEEERGAKVQNELAKNMNTRKTRKLGLYLPREKSKEDSKPESIRNTRTTSRFSSIQARRTTPQMLTVRTPLPMLSETEDEEEDLGLASDSTNDRPRLPRSPYENSDASTPATPMTPHVQSAPLTPSTKPLSWRWPKRPFSPARGKNKETEKTKTNDNPADHIGKVGNIWAKKTLGQLRMYHQRHSPSILSKGFGLSSPLKDSSSPLLSPVSDLSDAKKSPAVSISEQPLETINEEDEEEEGIGVWSSEEVDLTDSGVDDKSPRSPTIITPQIIEKPEEPRGMKVSPEYLTVVGGPTVNSDSPNASTTSLSLRNNPSNSPATKHSAKPIFKTTFTISNNTDEPLRYEILWPAFRFDISPAYGVVKPKGVMVVKISVTNRHLTVGSRRDEVRDSKKLMGILKGSGQSDGRPSVGRTRILVLCENGERGEVVVDVVQAKKKTTNKPEAENKNFMRTVHDLIKVAKARTKKSVKPIERNPRSTTVSKGKSSANKATGSSSKPSSAPGPRRSTSSRPTSRPSSPESNSNRHHGSVRKHIATSSTRSRPNTPDTHRSPSERTSPSPIGRSYTPERKNFISIGVPGVVCCPDTTIREENHSVFRIHNPTNKPVTWHLKTVTNPFLRRSDSTNSSQKINDEVFLIMKTCGLLRAGTTERVVVSFRPMFAGTYHQSFMLEDSSSPETSIGGMSVRIQGEGKVDVPSQSRVDARRGASKVVDFEVSEKKILIPATKIGRRKSVGIRISNPSSQLISVKCKCEVEGGTNLNSILSIPLSSVQIKPRAFVLLPVRFSPKEAREIRAAVKLQAVGRNEVQVDIVAEGVTDASTEMSQ